MTATELRALGLAAWGDDWLSPLARAMGVNKRTVGRWASGATVIPDAVSEKIRKVLGVGDTVNPDWPRDEWIAQHYGYDDGVRTYVVHTRRPRFIARVVECTEDGMPIPAHLPADVLTGVIYKIPNEHDDLLDDGYAILCEIVWIDAPPGERDILALMEAAADALEG